MLHLASKSPRRRELLARLGLDFGVLDIEVVEERAPGESPDAYVARVAREKAGAGLLRVVAVPGAVVLGSDTEVVLGDEVFGKPGTEARAIAQLQRMRGQTVVFHTALALLDTRSGHAQIDGVPTHVRFRDLSDDEIRRYVERERPLDCAGSAKSEGLGITLLEAMSGDDPTALIGLPLIALSRMLRAARVQLP